MELKMNPNFENELQAELGAKWDALTPTLAGRSTDQVRAALDEAGFNITDPNVLQQIADGDPVNLALRF